MLYRERPNFKGLSKKTDRVFFGIKRRAAVESAPPEKDKLGLEFSTELYGSINLSGSLTLYLVIFFVASKNLSLIPPLMINSSEINGLAIRIEASAK